MKIQALPNSVENEKAFLWCLFIDNSILKLTQNLAPEEFYNDTCSYVYKIIRKLHSDWKSIDLLIVNNELERQWKDLLDFLAECIGSIHTAVHWESYFAPIKATASKRSIIKLSEKIWALSYKENTSPKDIIEDLKIWVLELANKTNKARPKTWDDLKSLMYKELERKRLMKEEWKDLILNSHWLTFERWAHCVIWALPSHWKSMLLLAILLDLAVQGYKVLYVNIEMTEKQVLDRIYSYFTKVDSTVFKYMDAENILELIKRWEEAFDKIKDNFAMVTKWTISSWEISSIVWEMVMDKWLDVHWVDYLWILTEEWVSKTEKVSKSSNTLRSIAKDFNTISLTAAQFSKEWYKQKPSFAHIKDASTIFDDADLALVLYRLSEKSELGEPTHEINIEKNRTGNIWTMNYILNPTISQFELTNK